MKREIWEIMSPHGDGSIHFVKGIVFTSNSGAEYLCHDDPRFSGCPCSGRERLNKAYSWMFDGNVISRKPAYESTKHDVWNSRVKLVKILTEKQAYLIRDRLIAATQDMCAISIENPAHVSYSDKAENKYNHSRRLKTTLQRYCRRRLGITQAEISDRDLDLICWNVMGDGPARFEELKGKELLKAYRNEVGSHSCMTGDGMTEILYVYENNPDKVSLLVLEGKYRALLWTTDEGQRVLDRIYPNDGEHVSKYHKYVLENGWVHRIGNGYPSGTIKLSDDNRYTVTLKHNDMMPYMDTFMYGEQDGDKVTLCNYSGFGNLTFNNTDGSGFENYRCCDCGCNLDRDDRYISDDGEEYCNDCYYEHYYRCNECDREICTDDVISVDEGDQRLCRRCAERNANQCEHCGEWHTGSTYEVDGESWCSTCVDNDATFCDHCETYTEKRLKSVGDESWCPSCVSDDAEECSECGELFNKNELKESKDESFICVGCGEECGCGAWIARGQTCDDCERGADKDDDQESGPDSSGDAVQTVGGRDHEGRGDAEPESALIVH